MVERLFHEIASTLGPVLLLRDNAGILRDNLSLHLSEADWDTILDTNSKSAYLCCKATTYARNAFLSWNDLSIGIDGGLSL